MARQAAAPTTFYGVWVLRSAIVLGVFGWGVGFYGPPIFLQAVVERTGWALTLVSTAVTVHFLSGAALGANLPRLHRAYGVPMTIAFGSVVTVTGVVGWAMAEQSWQLMLSAMLSGMGWVTMSAVAVNAVIAPWFVRTRPAALSKVYNGATIGGVVFTPLWVALIAGQGFVFAAVAVGMVLVGVAWVLAAFVFTKSPESMQQHPDGDLHGASGPLTPTSGAPSLSGSALWRDRAFSTLALAMAAGLFAQTGLVAHLISLLGTTMGKSTAALVMAGATACAIAGRSIATRCLSVVRERRAVAAASYACQALGSTLLALSDAGQTELVLCGVVLVGFGFGNSTSLPPLIAQSDFGSHTAPRVVALIVSISQATYAFAPAAFGVLLSMSDTGVNALGIGRDSAAIFIAAAGAQLMAALLLVLGRRS